MPEATPERGNGWFEKHVVDGLDRLSTQVSALDVKVEGLTTEVHTRDLLIEGRLTRVEERSSRKGALYGGLAGLVPAIGVAIYFLLR